MTERRTAPLTPEEEAELIRYRDYTMKRGLQTGPVDRDEAEHIIRDVYTAAELAQPGLLVWADSPMAGVHLAGILVSIFKEGEYKVDDLKDEFRSQYPDIDVSEELFSKVVNEVAMEHAQRFLNE